MSADGQVVVRAVPGRAAPLTDSHGDWTLTIADDRPMPEGKGLALDRTVIYSFRGNEVKRQVCAAYKIWTVLAHWKDGLPDVPPGVAAEERDDPMWSPLFEEVWHAVTYKPGYRLLLKPDDVVPGGRWFFQVECERLDAITGQPGIGHGGKAYLTPHATRSELVQIAFALFKGYEEHECREFFRYDGQQVFGPHFDVAALHEIAAAGRTEYRA